MSAIAALALQKAGDVTSRLIDTGMGLMLEGHNDRRQRRQQEALQRLQIKGQKELTQYNMDRQLELWKATSYGAQREQMELADINPGLMYGMSGGGGQTASLATGSVSGSNAPAGGGEVATMMGMGMQMELMRAQKEVLQTQALKNKAEAEKTAGVDTEEAKTRIESLWQGIDNARNTYELQRLEMTMKNIENYEKQATQEDRLDYIEYSAKIAARQLNIIANDQKLSDETLKDKITIVREEAIGAAIRNELTRQQVNVSRETIKKIAADIAQGWEGLSIQERELKLNEIKTNFPGASQVTGRIINDAVESIFKLTGLNRGQHYNADKK